jgi:CRP-like cAMP-binding protein
MAPLNRATAPKRNQLLAALPEDVHTRISAHAELVELRLGQVIYESGARSQHIYFPVDSIVSLLYVMQNGASGEIAIVGSEGLVGFGLLMGGGSTPSKAVVQSAGIASRINAKYLREEFEEAGALQNIMLRYMQALLIQMGQTAICNRHHSVNQQFCRWLLMSLDRLDHNHLHMTQELIANMLGVRREGVTDAAGTLRRAGIIRYLRGHIEVLDRARLERAACECYEVVKKEFSRLLPWAAPGRAPLAGSDGYPAMSTIVTYPSRS